jgi:hypothetical protein
MPLEPIEPHTRDWLAARSAAKKLADGHREGKPASVQRKPPPTPPADAPAVLTRIDIS